MKYVITSGNALLGLPAGLEQQTIDITRDIGEVVVHSFELDEEWFRPADLKERDFPGVQEADQVMWHVAKLVRDNYLHGVQHAARVQAAIDASDEIVETDILNYESTGKYLSKERIHEMIAADPRLNVFDKQEEG